VTDDPRIEGCTTVVRRTERVRGLAVAALVVMLAAAGIAAIVDPGAPTDGRSFPRAVATRATPTAVPPSCEIPEASDQDFALIDRCSGMWSRGLRVVAGAVGVAALVSACGPVNARPAATTVAPKEAPVTTAPSTTPTTAPLSTVPTTMPVAPPTTVAPPAAARMGGGFSEGSTILWTSDADLVRQLDGMVSIGAKWLRVDVDWSVIERQRGTFDWSIPDRVINGARARGMSVLGMLAYTPAWARPAGTTDKCPPTDVGAFANFARAAAEHYQGVVSAFEIWNEPNSRHFWQPSPDPVAFTALLGAAYVAVKAVNPAATVVTGGFSPAPDAADGSMIAPATFLQRVYAAGGAGKFDAVGHHPSNYPFMPTRPETIFNYNAFGGVTPVLRNLMVLNGDGAKRIWATEMGAPVPFVVNGVATTPEYMASYITEAYETWKQWTWTGPLFWYSYRDGGTDPNDLEHHFGVVTNNFVPKEPALSAISAALRNV
jgi:hypothetical protein